MGDSQRNQSPRDGSLRTISDAQGAYDSPSRDGKRRVSRRIKIQKPKGDRQRDDEDSECRAREVEYDRATWRLYERIIRHRSRRELESAAGQEDDAEEEEAQAGGKVQEDSNNEVNYLPKEKDLEERSGDSFQFVMPKRYLAYDFPSFDADGPLEPVFESENDSSYYHELMFDLDL